MLSTNFKILQWFSITPRIIKIIFTVGLKAQWGQASSPRSSLTWRRVLLPSMVSPASSCPHSSFRSKIFAHPVLFLFTVLLPFSTSSSLSDLTPTSTGKLENASKIRIDPLLYPPIEHNSFPWKSLPKCVIITYLSTGLMF